jgi:hypothetical protein
MVKKAANVIKLSAIIEAFELQNRKKASLFCNHKNLAHSPLTFNLVVYNFIFSSSFKIMYFHNLHLKEKLKPTIIKSS